MVQRENFQTVTDGSGEQWRVPDFAKAVDPQTPRPIRIWDCIDEAWTSPLVRARVYDQYLIKRVVKCSACEYTTVFRADSLGGNLTPHLEQMNKAMASHEDAEMSAPIPNERGVASQICTGCGMPFQVGKGNPHIMQAQTTSAAHYHVEALLMNRFALESSEPIIFARELVVDGTRPVGEEPAAVSPLAAGRRRRRRKRGKH
jgi:hypothetical protein